MKDHCVFISEECKQIENEYSQHDIIDPLKDVLEKQAEEFYKLDDVVFAEPLEIGNNKNKDMFTNEFTFIDKVAIEKRTGKKNRKYHIDIDNSNVCPQETCKKSFKTVTLLKAHIRKVHCAVYMFVCEMCGVRFSAEYLLKRHMAVHEDRRIECPVCKKMLSERTSLSVHLRSHTGTRVHECNVCHRRFLRMSTMKNHIKFVHRKEKELACEKCLKRFPTRSLFMKHMCHTALDSRTTSN